MRIGIDCDGVLRDFIGAFRKVVAQEYPNQEIPWMVTSWRFEKDLPWLTGAEIKDLYREKFADIVFRDALPIDSRIMEFWALEKWAKKENHKLICVTSQWPKIRCHTLYWLGKHNLNFHEVIFEKGRLKWQKDIDWLIDDSPENYKNWVRGRGNDKNFIVCDALYNRDINSTYRINSLLDIQEIISNEIKK